VEENDRRPSTERADARGARRGRGIRVTFESV
jgi:hypothetical protein